MTISVANIGTATSTSGPTVTLAVPAGGVPAGAAIIVGVAEFSKSGAPAGSVTDSFGNAYASVDSVNCNASTAKGFANLFCAGNVGALQNGDSIMFTKAISGDRVAMSAFYATGVSPSPLDGAATAHATGANAAPSVTSGIPGSANDLFVGMVAINAPSVFTQDATNGAWATPFNEATTGSTSGTDIKIDGGFLVVADGLAHTYAPTYGTAHSWAAILAAFRPAGAGGGGSIIPVRRILKHVRR